LSSINYYVNFDNDVLTSEPLSNQEIISFLNNQSEELDEDDNSKEYDSPKEDLYISSEFNTVQIVSNYIALNNVNSKNKI